MKRDILLKKSKLLQNNQLLIITFSSHLLPGKIRPLNYWQYPSLLLLAFALGQCNLFYCLLQSNNIKQVYFSLKYEIPRALN